MSKLIELYEFRTGNDLYRVTTLGNDVIDGGRVFAGASFRRNDMAQSPELSRNDLKLEFPVDSAFALQFLGYGPDEETTVTVWRNSISNPNSYAVFWKGHIADCEATDKTITLVCQSIFVSAENSGLIARTQRFCRHVLYNYGCNVNKNAHAVASAITAIDSRYLVLTCPAAAAFPDNWFAGGMFTMPSGALRYVTASAGDQISLWRPAPDLAPLIGGVSTVLYPGCDGSRTTCDDKFNNLDNNGAFYWIPKVNPYGGVSVF